MLKFSARRWVLVLFSLFFLIQVGQAQMIVHSVNYEIPVSYDLIPENAEFENETEMARLILDIPEDRLKSAALAADMEVTEEKMIMYTDGNRVAVESEGGEMGKTTMISDMKTGKMHMIMWSAKKVLVMTPEEMKEMEKKSKEMAENMLKNMPPEMQAQVRAEMDKSQNAPASKMKAKATGKKMKKYGFDCEQYLMEDEGRMVSVWAAKDNSGLSKEVEKFSKQFEKIFNMNKNDDVDEWSLLPGKVPIVIARMHSGMGAMMGEQVVQLEVITAIEKKTPPADKFKIPGAAEGFTTGSYMDMMMQMMPGE